MPADPKPVPELGNDTDDGANICSGVGSSGPREADTATNAAPVRGVTGIGTQFDGTRKGVAGTEQPSFPDAPDTY